MEHLDLSGIVSDFDKMEASNCFELLPSTPPSTPRTILHSTPSSSRRQSQTFTFGHVDEDEIGDHSRPFVVGRPVSAPSGDINLWEMEGMNASQLRLALEESLLENSNLKCELVEKNRQLRSTKMKVKVLLDLEKGGDLDLFEASTSGMSQTYQTQERDYAQEMRSITVKNASVSVNTTTMANEVNVNSTTSTEGSSGVTVIPNTVGVNILPENTFVLIREITSRIEVHQVRERMIEGIHISNQLLLGGISGWTAAYLLKNFGKAALIALSGGVGLLALANHKGFVEINWNELFEEIQRRRFAPNESLGAENSSNESHNDSCEIWTSERIDKCKKWVKDHSITAAGFAGGFLYNIL